MARILEGPEFAEQNRMPQVDIRARGVNAELDPHGATSLLGLTNPGGKLLVAIGSSAAKLTRGEQIGDPALQALGQ
jgi:hypothetical protein